LTPDHGGRGAASPLEGVADARLGDKSRLAKWRLAEKLAGPNSAFFLESGLLPHIAVVTSVELATDRPSTIGPPQLLDGPR
jgi:hypothetical protein